MTIKEVAEIAHVSSAAVSRYFNGGSLSDRKRAMIHEAVEKTGYRPNVAGQMLRTGKLNQIGLIVPQIDSQSVSKIAEGIAERFRDTPYILILGTCGMNAETELNYIKSMQHNNVSGIILMGTNYYPRYTSVLQECQVPLVVTGQKYNGINCVYNDDFGAAEDLTKRILETGHRHIGYIGVSDKDPAVGTERRKGVEHALEEVGLKAKSMAKTVVSFHPDNIREAVLDIISQDPSMDALICATDRIALMAMSVLKSLGRRVPEDTAVAGFDNNWASELSEPGLSTVDFHQKACGAQAADMILNLVEKNGDEPVQHTRLGYTVIERGSY